MPRRNFLCILAAAVVSLACYRVADRNPYGRYFGDVMNKIDQLYIEPVDKQDLFDAAMKGMLADLDKYSDFYGPQQMDLFLARIDQQYAGIGIQVGTDPKSEKLTVVTTLVGSPAYEADIHSGDLIAQIDGRETQKLTVDEVAELIRGKVGTPVKLVLERAGREKPLELTLTRSTVKVDSVLGDTRNADDTWNFHLHGHPDIGYIRITNFGDFTAAELSKAVAALEQEHVKNLVLDLRFNPGGRLDAAVDVSSLFIPTGQKVVSTKDRSGKVLDVELSHEPSIMPDVPMAVLINSQSASASEIVAACLQDYHRAAICGQRSFGKGTVQKLLGVEGNKSLLKLTTAYYAPPSDRKIHRTKNSKEADQWGVLPDAGLAVEMDAKQDDALRKAWSDRDVVRKGSVAPAANSVDILELDPQLRRAIEHLEKAASSPPHQGA